jgi:hypothetical protein
MGMGKDKDKSAPIKAEQSALKEMEDKNIQSSLIKMGSKVSKYEGNIISLKNDVNSSKVDKKLKKD